MFIKPILKRIQSTGEYKTYYRLVESYRINDNVRHQTIVQLGLLEELNDIEQIRKLGMRIASLVKQSRTGIVDMFACEDKTIEALAQIFFIEIKQKKRIDLGLNSDNQNVKIDTIENKNIREVGSEWMCKQAIEQLQLTTFLLAKGWDEQAINLALTHIISRACYPASELRTCLLYTSDAADE